MTLARFGIWTLITSKVWRLYLPKSVLWGFRCRASMICFVLGVRMDNNQLILFINSILKSTNGKSLKKTSPLQQTKYIAATSTTLSRFCYSIQGITSRSLTFLTFKEFTSTDRALKEEGRLDFTQSPGNQKTRCICSTGTTICTFMKWPLGIGSLIPIDYLT